MESDVIAARILQGMLEDQAYIFPLPDHKEELAGYFQEELGDYRDYPHEIGYDERIKNRSHAPREGQDGKGRGKEGDVTGTPAFDYARRR